MKLNFKGFFKAAGLFPLALMLSGCISYALVSHTAKGSSGKYQSQSDTITGLSQAKDSNGTKGYVFVGESLDTLSLMVPMTSLRCSMIQHLTGTIFRLPMTQDLF